MSRSDRRVAALRRLRDRFGAGTTEADVAGLALASVHSNVDERGALTEDEVLREAQDETARMRKERREGVSAG